MTEPIETTLHAAVDQMHEGIQIIDRQWRYVYVNEAAVKHSRLPRESLIGRKMTEVFPQINDTDLWRTLNGVMESLVPRQMENLFEYEGADKVWYEIFVEPYVNGILIRSIDITSKKRMQEEMHFAQKMEAIGRLAGGVAHDFNNKLSVITVLAEMVLERNAGDPQNSKMLGAILQACEQSATLTRQLLAFSRKEVMEMKVCSLNDALHETCLGLQTLLGESIRVECRMAKDVGNVRIDPSHMDQIFLNLVINARDAMPGGGRLVVETKNATLDEEYCRHRPEIMPGEYVELSVSDTGIGMSAAVRARLFEPFFTTKARGKGTGLGMSMVHGIMTQFHGHVRVISQPGVGTTIQCFLPRIFEKATIEDYSLSRTLPAGGSETILVVEDEAVLREAMQSILRQAGYRVFATALPEEAKKVFEANNVDLLVTDVVLPHSDGNLLSRDLKAVSPSLKILYVSGYDQDSLEAYGVNPSEDVLLRKPITTGKLLQSVRKLLDGHLQHGVI